VATKFLCQCHRQSRPKPSAKFWAVVYIVVGTANVRAEPNWQNDTFVLRLNALGTITHQRVFGGPEWRMPSPFRSRPTVATSSQATLRPSVREDSTRGYSSSMPMPVSRLHLHGNIERGAQCHRHYRAVSTSGTAASGNAASVNAAITSSDSSALHLQQCYYAVPAATEVPTLSGWVRVSLVGLVLLSAAAALRGRRLNERRH